MKLAEIGIDPEFAGLCPPLTEEEFAGLKSAIRAEGQRDGIVMWRGKIVDGHNRHKAISEIQAEDGTGFLVKILEREFEDRAAAINWIIENQLARRNATEEQKRYLRGKRYLAEKGPQHRPAGKTTAKGRTGERLAAEHGVNETTIRKDAAYAKAVDKLAEDAPEVKSQILSGKLVRRGEVMRLATQPKAVRKVALNGGREAIRATLAEAAGANTGSPASDGFFKVVDAALKKLDGFDAAAMQDAEGWNKRRNAEIPDTLKALIAAATEVREQFQALNRKAAAAKRSRAKAKAAK